MSPNCIWDKNHNLMVTTEHVCQCQSLWKRKAPHFQQCFQLRTEGAELCTEVFVLCLYLGTPWTPAGRAQSCWCQHPSCATFMVGSFTGPLNRGRSNSFLPSAVLSWLLNFLKIPFQITCFSLSYLLPITTSYQSSWCFLLRYLPPNLFVESFSVSLSRGCSELYPEKYLIL